MEEILRDDGYGGRLGRIYEVRLTGQELALITILDGFVTGNKSGLYERLAKSAGQVIGYTGNGWVRAQEDLRVVVQGAINISSGEE